MSTTPPAEFTAAENPERRSGLGRRGLLLGAGLGIGALALGGTAAASGPTTASSPGRGDLAVPVPVPVQAPATEGYAAFDGGNLWYWDTGGRGEPVVLMHAATGSAASWVYQQPFLAAAGYRVIGYSRRGHRNSEPGPDDNFGTYAGDLLALADHLRLGRFHLIGTAAGSIGAADFALTYPNRVASAALTCSLITVGDPEFAARNSALRPPQWSTLPASFQELGPSYRAVDPAGTAAWSAEAATAPPVSRRQGTSTPVTAAGLAASSVPLLLATGDADLYMPPAMLREMAVQIPRADLVIFTDSGHNAYWERPAAFNGTVLKFLRKNRVRGR